MSHALEIVDDFQRNWFVLATSSLLEKVVVDGQVGVGEVEFDLSADLVWVVGLGLLFEAGLDVLAAVVVVVAATASASATATSIVAVMG